MVQYYLEGKKLNQVEKNKAAKDGLEIGKDIYKFAEMGWEQMDKTDLELRLKWYGMFWRPKTPGKFMLRLRIPNGIINAEQLKVIASIVARYGENGFGYDPIFEVNGTSLTFAEMPAKQKQEFSHRGRAFAKLLPGLKNSFNF